MNHRKIILVLMSAVCVLLAILLVASAVSIYLEGAARKAENPLASIYTPENVAEKLIWTWPLLAILAALLIISFALGIKPGPERPAGPPATPRPAPAQKHEKLIRTVLVAAAAGFILAGILNGSALDVLQKAIAICSECIGLG